MSRTGTARTSQYLPGVGIEEAHNLSQRWADPCEGIRDPNTRARWNAREQCWEGRPMHWGRRDSRLILEQKQAASEYACEVQEFHLKSRRPLQEAGTSADLTPYLTTALMLQRDWLPRHMGFDWFGIWPISQPGGTVFYQHYVKDNTGHADDGQSLALASARNNSYGAHVEGASDVMGVKRSMEKKSITMYSRAIKNESSVEEIQDFYAYFGMIAQEEDRAAIADELLRESEGTCIAALLTQATGGNVNFSTTVPDGLDWVNTISFNRSIFQAVVDAQNLVYSKRYRRPNWAVGGINETARFTKTSDFTASQGLTDADFSVGRHYLGTINNVLSLYADPFFPTANTILFGIKGSTQTSSPAVFSPYVGFFMSDRITDPNDMTTRQGLMMRWGFTVVRPECFATLTLVSSL